jgi:hypothetical protein
VRICSEGRFVQPPDVIDGLQLDEQVAAAEG